MRTSLRMPPRPGCAQDFLPVFSAGNEGEFGYFSITNPAMAKNCIAVGASEVKDAINPTFNNDDMAFFSSMGPTFDNRCARLLSMLPCH